MHTSLLTGARWGLDTPLANRQHNSIVELLKSVAHHQPDLRPLCHPSTPTSPEVAQSSPSTSNALLAAAQRTAQTRRLRATMASSSFRDSMNNLGWSRREQTANTNQTNPLLGSLSRLNPFGGEGNVRLPTTEGEGPGAPLPARTRREEEEGWFARKFALHPSLLVCSHLPCLGACLRALFLRYACIVHAVPWGRMRPSCRPHKEQDGARARSPPREAFSHCNPLREPPP